MISFIMRNLALAHVFTLWGMFRRMSLMTEHTQVGQIAFDIIPSPPSFLGRKNPSGQQDYQIYITHTISPSDSIIVGLMSHFIIANPDSGEK